MMTVSFVSVCVCLVKNRTNNENECEEEVLPHRGKRSIYSTVTESELKSSKHQ